MADSNALPSTPAPEPGDNNPELTVVPSNKPKRARSQVSKADLADLSKAESVTANARKPEYAPTLAARKIEDDFLDKMEANLKLARGHIQSATDADADSKDATRDSKTAQETLVKGLQAIQAAARTEHLPEHPDMLDGYYVGQRLDANRPTLENLSQNLIDKADTKRPGGMDTGFLNQVTEQRDDYVATGRDQKSHRNTGKLERGVFRKLLRTIVADRKKIQYAADSAWPSGKPENAKARADFQLPADRPYSH
jgi:hypothetical protein